MDATRTVDERTAGAVREFVARASRRFAVRQPPATAPVSVRLEMADIAYGMLLETGIHIRPLPMALEQWLDPDRNATPRLVRDIQREGVVM